MIKIPGEPEFPEDKPEIASGLPREYTKEDYEKHRGTEDEIIARQEKVANYKTLNPTIDMKKIQEFLHLDGIDVSLMTISRDVREIEDRSWQWSDRLALSGFVWSCQEAVKRNDMMIAKLLLALERSEDKEKAQIARTINELQLSKLNLQGRATYLRLKKARDKYMSAEAIAEARRS